MRSFQTPFSFLSLFFLEVLRLVLKLNGETVRKALSHIDSFHRGTENFIDYNTRQKKRRVSLHNAIPAVVIAASPSYLNASTS